MRILKRLASVVSLLASGFFCVVAFAEAGGNIPEGLARIVAPLALGGAGALLLLSVMLFFASRKPKGK
jgi:hypothetical protein